MQRFSYFQWRHEISFGLNKNQLNASFSRRVRPKITPAKEKKKRKTGEKNYNKLATLGLSSLCPERQKKLVEGRGLFRQ